ncbi:MAG: sodium:proton antiporter NhaD [Bacteroidales bacterium]|nr:sodium:proton antiporter NhaD [Bacteroidales bacterium]
MLTIAIVAVFMTGYACIALESVIKVNKAAIALLMFVACWTLFMLAPEIYFPGTKDAIGVTLESIEGCLGETSTTLFFLMGAMTIVEVVDQNGGFNFVRDLLGTTSKRKLLWRIALMTFFLSAILDNLTTSIVLIMVLRKLVPLRHDRLIYDAIIVIAANSGGAFSPIGDVTTIMLWNSGMMTAARTIASLLIPSLLSMLIPAWLLQFALKGTLQQVDDDRPATSEQELKAWERKTVFVLGVGGLIFVPIFRYLTDLPPFMGILFVLAMLWITTELFYAHLKVDETASHRVARLLSHIDMATILFFLGILMAVNCLKQIGILTTLGQWLDSVSGGNHYLVTGIIGIVSSIVDNVPLVAGCMGMYPIATAGDMAVNGTFWQLLAYCAGVGGSMLIIGSAAGVVVMGLEGISFGWYLKRITPIALAGYLAGMLGYWLQTLL